MFHVLIKHGVDHDKADPRGQLNLCRLMLYNYSVGTCKEK